MQFYFEPLMDGWNSYLIFKEEPRPLKRKLIEAACIPDFVLLITTDLLTVGEGWKADQLVNQEL